MKRYANVGRSVRGTARGAAHLLLWGLVVLLASGCAREEGLYFGLDMQGRNPDDFRILRRDDETARERKEAAIEGRQQIATLLWAGFGDPNDPYVLPESGLDLGLLKLAAGPVRSDQYGAHTGLFRQHCMHCHGLNGDGAGPTALFLNPYPRDFRKGVFKFTSTGEGMRATTADLKRTLLEGIPGTAMPSFGLLPDAEVNALVEYVKYLALRGQLEELLFAYLDAEEELPADYDSLAAEVSSLAAQWEAAENGVIEPDQQSLPDVASAADLQASIARGREIFRDAEKAQCVKCHGIAALGDGGDEQLFDDWNKNKPANDSPEIAWWNLPRQELQPRNLRLGIYRGGRRPIDLYYRIFAGIKGTPMPAAGKVLTPEQIWDLINYVKSLPYEHDTPHAVAEPQLAERSRL